jgi:hypothetical protein
MPRNVAKYTAKHAKILGLPKTVRFIAPWGEEMIVNVGDYIIQDGFGFYRIDAHMFRRTYKKTFQTITT